MTLNPDGTLAGMTRIRIVPAVQGRFEPFEVSWPQVPSRGDSVQVNRVGYANPISMMVTSVSWRLDGSARLVLR